MNLWHDIRFAVRAMRKGRSLTVIALLTLALGIGANTAIFSIVDAVLLRPLPFHDPGQLVQLRADLRGLGAQNIGFSYPEFEDLSRRSGIFDDVSVAWQAPANLTGGEQPERVDTLGVSPNYFALLGVRPEIGRLFDSRDVAAGFAEAAVISDGLWHRDFGGDPNILGRKVRLDNDLYTIVGVVPPSFHHPQSAAAFPVDIWATAGFRDNPFPPPVRNIRFLPALIGRLKPGISVQQAQARLQIFADDLRKQYGSDYPSNAGWSLTTVPLKDVVVGNSQTLVLSMLLAVALILLIACVNVASLLLARSSSRHREIALRTALGASRGRIIRQLLTESAVLSFCAAAVGTAAALLTEHSLVALLPAQLPQINQIRIDLPVLLYSIGLAIVTSILFGLAPALQTSRADANALKQDGRSGVTSLQAGRSRKLLVGAEVALSLTLVITAGLLLRTFWGLLHVDPGFNSHHVLAANVWLPVPNDPKTDVYQTTAQRTAFVRELLRRLHEFPGVESAAISSALPLKTQLISQPFRVEGKPDNGSPSVAEPVLVSPEFFRALNGVLLRGRLLRESDDEKASNVALVDEAAAKSLWPGEDPMGRRLRFGGNILVNGKLQPSPWMTVVGVVRNLKFDKLDEQNVSHVYGSIYQTSGKFFNVVVKATGDPAALGRDIQEQVQSVDPNLPVSGVLSMNEVVSESVAGRRFVAALIGIFAFLALALASIGVYGIASYTVAQRTQELGIRAALGATAPDLLRMVLRDGMAPVLAGLVAGCIAAPLLSRMVTSLLFGVRLIDPLVYVVSTVMLIGIGWIANYLPARRAARIDPNRALRYE